MTHSQQHPQTGRPVGAPVDGKPAARPGPVTLAGRYGRVEKLKPGDAAALEDPYAYAVVDGTGRAAGIITLMALRPEHRVVEVGHVLSSPALQRTPLATEAQYLLARYVFETLNYRRYEWKCDALNAASRRAALRYGFAFEGIFRQHLIGKGRNRDTAWYAMLDGEWPARKATFERWLAPDNFAADGLQKSSLSALNGLTE